MRIFLVLLFTLVAAAANAAQVRFDFSAVSGLTVNGYITWDYSVFDGSASVKADNTDIIDMNLMFAGNSYTTADLSLSPGVGTFFDDTGALPIITGAIGLLTATDRVLIRDGFPTNLVQFDLESGIGGSGVARAQAKVIGAAVPLPASGVLLSFGLAAALAGTRMSRRHRQD